MKRNMNDIQGLIVSESFTSHAPSTWKAPYQPDKETTFERADSHYNPVLIPPIILISRLRKQAIGNAKLQITFVSLQWNSLFQREKHFVSKRETVCFKGMKHFVSPHWNTLFQYNETLCFLPRNKVFHTENQKISPYPEDFAYVCGAYLLQAFRTRDRYL